MASKNFYWVCAVLTLSACANPAVPSVGSTVALQSSANQLKAPLQRKQITFTVNLDQPLRTQCNCGATYFQLEIKGTGNLSRPLYAINADTNGMIPIQSGATQVSVTAEVPEGPNWVAYANLYTTDLPDQKPIQQVGGVFHVADNEDPQIIEMSLRALQTAQVIEALHILGSNKVLSPLDLEAYQALSNKLLGVEQLPDGTYKMNRLPGMDDPNQLLDAAAIANLIENGQLDPQHPEGAETIPVDELVPQPRVQNSFMARSLTTGLKKLVMNRNGDIFGFDLIQNSQRVYALKSDDYSYVFPSFNITPASMRNIYLSLGQANTAGNSPQKVFYTYTYEGLNKMFLRAYSQTDGSLVWSYSFGTVAALNSDYVPTVLHQDQDTLTLEDDQDLIFTTLDTNSEAPERGAYAIKNGQEIWHTTLDYQFNNAGALSPDGQQLYLVSRASVMQPSKLFALNTQTGAKLWEQTIDGGNTGQPAGQTNRTASTNTPVIGFDGTIYMTSSSSQLSNNDYPGYVSAFSPATGTPLWHRQLPAYSDFTPVVDHRDGKDRLYITSQRGLISALDGSDGSVIWSHLLKGTAGEGPRDAPLLAEDTGGTRTLYQAMGNGLIYAVRDHGARPQLLWAKAPGAKVSSGMVLKDNLLHVPTFDGGEGQFIQMKTVRVHSPRLASTAPWPITGGNPSASGISNLTYQAQGNQ